MLLRNKYLCTKSYEISPGIYTCSSHNTVGYWFAQSACVGRIKALRFVNQEDFSKTDLATTFKRVKRVKRFKHLNALEADKNVCKMSC